MTENVTKNRSMIETVIVKEIEIVISKSLAQIATNMINQLNDQETTDPTIIATRTLLRSIKYHKNLFHKDKKLPAVVVEWILITISIKLHHQMKFDCGIQMINRLSRYYGYQRPNESPDAELQNCDPHVSNRLKNQELELPFYSFRYKP